MPAERSENQVDTIRLTGTLVLLMSCTFLWVVLLTFDPFDPPGTLAWPCNDPPANGGGRIGAWVAYQMMWYLGTGSYALTALLSLGVAARLWRGRISEWPLRLIGLLLVVAVTSGAAGLLSPASASGWNSAGGILGMAVIKLLSAHTSKVVMAMIFLITMLVGLLLAADEIVLRALRIARRFCRYSRSVWATAYAYGSPVRMETGTRARKSQAQDDRSLLRKGHDVINGLAQSLAGRFAALREARRIRADEASRAERDARAKKKTDPSQPESRHPKTAPDKPATPTPIHSPDTADQNIPNSAAEDDADDNPPGALAPPTHADQRANAPPAAKDDQPLAAAVIADAPAAPAPAIDAPPPQQPRPEPVVRTIGSQRQKPQANPWPTELGDYVLPPVELLDEPEYQYVAAQEAIVREKGRLLEQTLQEFRIDARVTEIDTGPVITMFELSLAPGIKVSQIATLSNDIARALKAPAIRVVAPIPGKDTVGIEVPNVDKEKVRLKELITLSGVKHTKMALPLFLGKDASGNPLIADLTAMPHCLIAGTTGSGKSVCINSLIMSILMTQRPDHVKVVLIDPKMVEMSTFKEIPHLMCPIVTDMNKAEMILEWAATKMDERYELLAEAGVRHIINFNRLGKDEIYRRFNPSNDDEKAQIPTHLPYIVILIDELADLMLTSGKAVEHHLCRIAQKSRAVGIHVVLATQRPQANVVTGLIKSNMPSRVAFRVASRMDSRIVLDQNGAEVLMGQGDMLFLPPGTSKLVRAQGTFIEDDELKRILDDLKSKASPEFHHELVRLRPTGGESTGERDPLFDDAVLIVIETKRGSVSLLQRRLAIGYTRASRLIDQMAFAGIVGDHKGSQQREVLVTADEWSAMRTRRDDEVAHGNYEADQTDTTDDDGVE